jgi:hypothetical protein
MSDACFSAISLNSGVTNMTVSRFTVYAYISNSYCKNLLPLGVYCANSPPGCLANYYSLRSSSLMLVLARVLASTCFTITAQ